MADQRSGISVDGNQAHDQPDTGDPIKIGGVAYTTLPAAVATGDRVDGVYTAQGAITIAAVDGTTPIGLQASDDGHLITSTDAATLALADGISNTVNLAVDGAHAFYGAATFPFVFNGTTWDRVRGAAATGLEVDIVQSIFMVVDGTVTHDDPDANNPIKIGGFASAAAPADVGANDRVNAWFDPNGALHVIVTAADGELAEVSALDSDAVAESRRGLAVGAFGHVFNGATWDRMLEGSRAGSLLVDADASGNIAHDDPDSGNPVKIGGRANAAAPAGVAENDRVNAWFLLNGAQSVGLTSSGNQIASVATAASDAVAASAAGLATRALGYGFNGTTWDRLRSAIGTGLEVDIVQSVDLVVDGDLTHDNAAPAATQIGALVAIANAAGPTWTEGNQVLLSTDLSGALRVSGTPVAGVIEGDTAHDDPDTGDPVKMGGFASSGQPTPVDSGDRVNAWFGLGGEQRVTVVNTGGDHMEVLATQTDALANNTNAAVAAALGYVFNGTTFDRVRAGDRAGSLLVDADGNLAHDDPDAGNPIKIGGRAQSTLPALVADDDRVDTLHDRSGRIVTAPVGLPEMQDRLRTVLTDANETTIAGATAAEFHDLTMLTLSNDSASEVSVDIRDDTGGTILMTIDLAADGGGAIIPFSGEPWYQALVNDNWTAEASGAVSSVYITAIWNRRAA